jgi:serine/threonine protein phosphatase PrpC
MLTVRAAGRSHVGLVRRRNEDALYVGQSLFAVADGLGGHPAGDVASAVAIEALRPYDRPTESPELAATLGRAVRSANDALRQRIAADAQLAGMGTTLVALLCAGTRAALANIGDSRAYLLRGRGTASETVRITEDHTYGALVAGADAVPGLPDTLARWLDGRADGRSPDLTFWEVRPTDRFLLCSDGLSSYVPLDRINAVLASSPDPSEAVDRLVSLALDNGGPDNITVILIDAHEEPARFG